MEGPLVDDDAAADDGGGGADDALVVVDLPASMALAEAAEEFEPRSPANCLWFHNDLKRGKKV